MLPCRCLACHRSTAKTLSPASTAAACRPTVVWWFFARSSAGCRSPIVWPPASTIRVIPPAPCIRSRTSSAFGERLPSERDLCSQSTISRLENLPDARTLLRLGRALVDLYCASFRQVPRRITLDIDDTFDAVHGGQQLRLFNAHYDDYGFQPIVIFDQDGRFVTAVLRPAKRPKGVEIRAFLRRLIRAIRSNWPNVEILVRADSHYACPEVLDWCEANGIDYV